ncbi:MAG TPA: flagellar basal body P-ring protein FlgI [Terriglobales bacterium]|jgi:flagellar P-ring protein precursor FlgI|nr:flagellar basal body P-ring protein FlgI [Terriglobales bacterium]
MMCVSLLNAAAETTGSTSRQVLLRDITTISGVRSNPLLGYGIVVGLNGTGDRRQTLFTTQMLASALQKMGAQIPAASVRVNNIAAVMVTSSLPEFARPGMTQDVLVSSMGDAKSLEGGVLLLTSLRGADGEIYAAAQGPITFGGYSAGLGGNSKQVNSTTVGRIPEGATVERDVSIDLSKMKTVSLMLRDPDFSAARDVAAAINHEFGKEVATPLDSRRIDVDVNHSGIPSVPILIAKVQNLGISFHPPAKVVINERTGTIVMGADVKLSPVAVMHGNLTVEVATTFSVSQPEPFSKNGDTVVVPQPELHVNAEAARSIRLADGASVEELINGLQSIGATARDIISILQSIKAAGGLHAELEVL